MPSTSTQSVNTIYNFNNEVQDEFIINTGQSSNQADSVESIMIQEFIVSPESIPSTSSGSSTNDVTMNNQQQPPSSKSPYELKTIFKNCVFDWNNVQNVIMDTLN